MQGVKNFTTCEKMKATRFNKSVHIVGYADVEAVKETFRNLVIAGVEDRLRINVYKTKPIPYYQF